MVEPVRSLGVRNERTVNTSGGAETFPQTVVGSHGGCVSRGGFKNLSGAKMRDGLER